MANKFQLTVASLKGLVFQEDVESVYLYGTDGEFELLPFHYPLLASLTRSMVEIKGHDPLPVRTGVVMFRDNACTIVAEMEREFEALKQAWV